MLADMCQGYHSHDTHALPPQAICDAYKRYQRMDDAAVSADLEIIDFTRGLTEEQDRKLVPVDTIPSELITVALKAFKVEREEKSAGIPEACTVYEHYDFPGTTSFCLSLSPIPVPKVISDKTRGLRLLPSLLPPSCQNAFVSRLLHRDLSNPLHTTNLHHDYNIPYPPSVDTSFFSYPQSSRDKVFIPKHLHTSHKPLNTAQFLQKKLRYVTLGSQYDWATRSYPTSTPTPFPDDISRLVTTLFQNAFKPESGVVLLYSTKDYMPVHRDVSEECGRGLASFTLGCDGLFVIAKDKFGDEEGKDDREQEIVCIRVRSGDVVQMGGETRWAWHAMPKIIGGTCPEEMREWPVGSLGEGVEEPNEFERWRGYMRTKRLNISCRQVWS